MCMHAMTTLGLLAYGPVSALGKDGVWIFLTLGAGLLCCNSPAMRQCRIQQAPSNASRDGGTRAQRIGRRAAGKLAQPTVICLRGNSAHARQPSSLWLSLSAAWG